jgi:Tol biopolymer transport system component
VAALNHSGIAGIHELGEAEGQKFLVLELIEGDTLADRLKRGPLALDDTLQIAKQILEALEAAHEKGIAHRDLKPANIKLTTDGTVKILDFGLAKFLQSGTAAPNLTHSPTLSLAGTYPGVVLGTAGYMSPEQAKGFEADQRSDIFAFGCILFEMLTGRQAFEAETASEILAAVLMREVDLTTLPSRLNPRLVELLKRCLEKNPKKRWHAAADVRVEIEAVMGRATVTDESPAAASISRPLWKRALALGAAALVGSLATGYAMWRMRAEPARPITRFNVPLGEGQQFTNPGRQLVALSPDGSHLVYVANSRFYLRSLSGLSARPIAGSEGVSGSLNPVFSPEGRSLVFFSNADGKLKRLDVNGGVPVTLCAATNVNGLSWYRDDILFGQGSTNSPFGRGILRVSANGGTPQVIVAAKDDETLDAPQLINEGRTVLFTARKTTANSWDMADIVWRWVMPPRPISEYSIARATQPFKLPPGPYRAPRASPDGTRVAFENANAKQTFIQVFTLGGGAAQRLTFDGNSAAPVWSADGRWIYFQSDREGDHAIFRQRADGAGVEERLTKAEKGSAHIPQSASPDGQHLLYAIRKGDEALADNSLWTLSLKDRQSTQLKDIRAREAAFSPDGRWIAYQARAEIITAVYVEPFPQTGAKYQVPLRTSAGHPVWLAKGRELMLNTGPTRSDLVSVTTSAGVTFGSPAEYPRIGRTDPNPTPARRNSDAMPDRDHLVGVISTIAQSTFTASEITIVLNWFEELKQRVPIK